MRFQLTDNVLALNGVEKCRWDFIRLGGKTFKDMDRLVAYETALKTWAEWADSSIDPNKTKIFFQGVSPDHNE